MNFFKCNKKLFLLLCIKCKLEMLRGHKIVPVMSDKFDLLLLSSLQCIKNSIQSDSLWVTLYTLDYIKYYIFFIFYNIESQTSKPRNRSRFAPKFVVETHMTLKSIVNVKDENKLTEKKYRHALFLEMRKFKYTNPRSTIFKGKC